MFRSIPDPHKHTRHSGGERNFLLFQHRTLNAIQNSLQPYRSAAFVKYPGWRGAARCVYRPCLMELPQHPSAGWPPPSSPALSSYHTLKHILNPRDQPVIPIPPAHTCLWPTGVSKLCQIGEILSAASRSLAHFWHVFAWTCDSFCFVVT